MPLWCLRSAQPGRSACPRSCAFSVVLEQCRLLNRYVPASAQEALLLTCLCWLIGCAVRPAPSCCAGPRLRNIPTLAGRSAPVAPHRPGAGVGQPSAARATLDFPTLRGTQPLLLPPALDFLTLRAIAPQHPGLSPVGAERAPPSDGGDVRTWCGRSPHHSRCAS